MRINRIAPFLTLFTLIARYNATAQFDSCRLRISLLTCTPGNELYSTFGHSAIRVTDSVNHRDIVFNYGTFNFDEPDFYSKFIRGKLLYYLSTEDFPSFEEDYETDQRGITEQVLNLDCLEKYEVLMYLQANLMGRNRFYKYDFLYDNCTTRLRDLIEKITNHQVQFKNVLIAPKSFRDLIHEYLNKNDKQWDKLGIDILLGRPVDKMMSVGQVMFLPDYLMKSFDSARVDGRTLVKKTRQLYNVNSLPAAKSDLINPLITFSLLFVIIIILSYSGNPAVAKILSGFDGLLYFVTGLLGAILLFMWVGTDHPECNDNFNLLWAWPTNVVIAFFVHSSGKFFQKYILVYSWFNIFLLAIWFFLPQHLNPALIPIIAIMIFRGLVFIPQNN
jgi:Domain of unknown function (DUF4105)